MTEHATPAQWRTIWRGTIDGFEAGAALEHRDYYNPTDQLALAVTSLEQTGIRWTGTIGPDVTPDVDCTGELERVVLRAIRIAQDVAARRFRPAHHAWREGACGPWAYSDPRSRVRLARRGELTVMRSDFHFFVTDDARPGRAADVLEPRDRGILEGLGMPPGLIDHFLGAHAQAQV